MTFHQIMAALSKMYNSYEATCWLNKGRRSWAGDSAADLMKDGRFEDVSIVLKREARYKRSHADSN